MRTNKCYMYDDVLHVTYTELLNKLMTVDIIKFPASQHVVQLENP